MTLSLAPDLGVLSEEMLERFAARAPVYDAENRFFAEDFTELRHAGYLLLAVPAGLGGLGGNLIQVCHQQRRLAARAPATALATTMHLYWTVWPPACTGRVTARWPGCSRRRRRRGVCLRPR